MYFANPRFDFLVGHYIWPFGNYQILWLFCPGPEVVTISDIYCIEMLTQTYKHILPCRPLWQFPWRRESRPALIRWLPVFASPSGSCGWCRILSFSPGRQWPFHEQGISQTASGPVSHLATCYNKSEIYLIFPSRVQTLLQTEFNNVLMWYFQGLSYKLLMYSRNRL